MASSYWAIVLFIRPSFSDRDFPVYRFHPHDSHEWMRPLIDGCSRYSIFFGSFSAAQTGTASVIILTMLSVWNDYQFSLFFRKEERFNGPLSCRNSSHSIKTICR
jgi:hypothetical protein